MKIFTHFVLLKKILTQRGARVILYFLLLNFLYVQASAQTVNIIVNPASTTVANGGSFTVAVRYDFIAAGSMDAAEVHLTFDNTKLQVASITRPFSDSFNVDVVPLEPIGTINTNGQINYSAGTFSAANFPNADFDFLYITFNVIGGVGTTTPLTLLETFPPTDAISSGLSVKNVVINGSVSITAVGCTTPQATISAAPTCDASAFNLVLTSSSAGTAPFDLTINGTTYNDIGIGGVITNFAPPVSRIWPAPPAPTPATNEDASITLGVRFQSSVTGFVKGVRFFSPDDAGGTFTGQLWTLGGTLLASGTFAGVVADSWNELTFSDPVLITAGTTYVASYHTTAIKYVATTGGLTAPVVNGTLTALAGGGVFTYGATPTFPATGTNNNYWADVIFSPNNYVFNLTTITDAGGCIATGSPNIQTLNVTSGECGTLPVSLANFSATPGNNNVTLRWSTSSEINNLGFEIQRSIDGSGGWTTLGFVNGAGNSATTLNYSYVDENLSASRYYYRLKQVDIDQRYAYSPIVTAVLDGKKTFQLEQNYPNPFRNETVVRFTLPQKSKVNLSLFDMNGRLVKVLVNESKDSGTHAVTISSGMFTSGMYYYKLQAGDFSAVKKMTVQ